MSFSHEEYESIVTTTCDSGYDITSDKASVEPSHPSPIWWTLESARALIKVWQKEVKPFGYHLCLGGGVLNKGYSDKDLDLYYLPLNNEDNPKKPEDLMEYLGETFGKIKPFGRVSEYPGENEPYVFKAKARYEKRRVDLFVLGTPIDADICQNVFESNGNWETVVFQSKQIAKEV